MGGKLFLVLFIFVTFSIKAQIYTMQNGVFSTCSGTFYDSGGAANDYSSNENFEITFCPATPGTYVQLQFTDFNVEGEPRDFMRIYSGTGTTGTLLGTYGNFSPVGCSGGILSSDPSGCLTITFESDNNTENSGWEATISCSPTPNTIVAPTNSVCPGADPFCADAGSLEFPNLSTCDNVPDAPAVITNNTCLDTAPNPAWYYLSVAIPGRLELSIEQSTGPGGTGTGLDVDYAIWGPFPDQFTACANFTLGDCVDDHDCSGNVVDCSYSTAPVESAVIPNALVGEIYMVLITNYDGAAGYISMTQTNTGDIGAGATDCSILCPTAVGTNPTCGIANGKITISGLAASTSYNVTYLDDGVPVAATLSSNAIGQIIISGLNAGNYTNILTNFVGCTASPTSVVLVATLPPALIGISAPTSVCIGTNVVYTITGTPNSVVTYHINTGGNLTVNLNSSGIATVAISAITVDTTLTATAITLSGCNVTLSNSKTVEVDPLPTIALSSAVATTNQTVCINTSIAPIAYTVGNGATTANATGLPTGVTGLFSSGAFTLSGTPTQGGIFNFSVTTIGGCAPAATLSGVLRVTLLPTATISYAGTPFCKSLNSGQPVTLSGTNAYTGGTYSALPAGLQINASTGVIVPSNSTAGTYTVTYTVPSSGGCSTVLATTSVTITGLPTAIIGYVGTPFCSTLTAPQSVSLSGTNAYSGGTFSSSGVGLTLNVNSGAIIPSSSVAGSYTITYTYPATGGCSSGQTTTSLVITSLPTSTINYGGTPFCKSLNAGQSVTLVGTNAYTGGIYSAQPAGLQLNASTGVIVPSNSTTGTYTVTYTVPASGGCSTVLATTSVTITGIPTAIISYPGTPFCSTLTGSQNVFLSGTNAYTGGTFSSSGAGLTLNVNSGAIIPSTSLAGLYTVSYTYPSTGGCSSGQSTTSLIITSLPTATINYPGTPFCMSVNTGQLVTLAGTNAYTGGTFSSQPEGLLLNASTGAILPSNSTAGIYSVIYTVPANGGCSTVAAATSVRITAIPTANISYVGSPFCSTLTAAQNVSLSGTNAYTAGTFTSSPVGLTFNINSGAVYPSTSLPDTYTVTYTTPASLGCSAVPTSTTVIIKPTPAVATSSLAMEICSGETTNITLNSTVPGTTFSYTTAQVNAVGSQNGSGNTIFQTLTTTVNGVGTVAYSVIPEANNCIGNPSSILVKVNPLPMPELYDGVICINQDTSQVIRTYVLDSGLSPAAYDFSWFHNTTNLGVDNYFYEASEAGLYEVIATNSTTGCVSFPASAEVTETLAAQAMVTSGYEAFTENPMVVVTVSGSGNYLYQLDNGSMQSSNVFYNVSLGEHTVKVTDLDGCTNLIETITVIGYPHFFTPNEDGYNDTWNIEGLSNDFRPVIYIFDRYGKLLKEISTRGKGWDGIYNGSQMPSSDYWFLIDYYEKNREKQFRSHFSLKR